MLQNCNKKHISTDGEVMSKIKMVSFFPGHGVDSRTARRIGRHRWIGLSRV